MSQEPSGIGWVDHLELVDDDLPLLLHLIDLMTDPYPHPTIVDAGQRARVGGSRVLDRNRHLSTFREGFDSTTPSDVIPTEAGEDAQPERSGITTAAIPPQGAGDAEQNGGAGFRFGLD